MADDTPLKEEDFFSLTRAAFDNAGKLERQASAAAAPPGTPPPAKPPGDAPPTPPPAGTPPEGEGHAELPPKPPASDPGGQAAWEKKRAADWKQLHDKADASAAEVKRLESELAALKQGTGDTDQLRKSNEELTKERDALSAQLEAVAVERHPKFQSMFDSRQKAALATAKSAVGLDKAKEIEDLLSLPDGSTRDNGLETFIEDLKPIARQKVLNAVAELDRLSAEKAQLSQRGSEIFKHMQAEEAQQRERNQKQREAQLSQVFESEVGQWRKIQPMDDSDVALAKQVFSGNADLESVARAAIWGITGPSVAKALYQAQARVKELEAELDRYKSSAPGLGSDAGGGQPGQGEADDVPAGADYGTAIAAKAKKMGLYSR